MISPLEQFGLKLIYPVRLDLSGLILDLSITMLLIVNLLIFIVMMGLVVNVQRHIWYVSPKAIMGLSLVDFVYSTVVQQSGTAGLVYFPVLFTLFFLILGSNLYGLIPFGFTTTSQISVTITLGLSVVLGIIILGFYLKGVEFFGIFVPSNVPSVLLPFLVIIEVVSFLIRPISLSLRLCANMMAGHISLNIIGSFSFALFFSYFTFGYIGAWFLMVVIFMLELGIAFLQSYVFLMLVCVYLNDAISRGGH
jgi:F-type H+-transporting ATPase subunit a